MNSFCQDEYNIYQHSDFPAQSPETAFQGHMAASMSCDFGKRFRNYWADLTINFQLSIELKKALLCTTTHQPSLSLALFPVSLKCSCASRTCEALDHFANYYRSRAEFAMGRVRMEQSLQWTQNNRDGKELLSAPDYRLICQKQPVEVIKLNTAYFFLVYTSVTPEFSWFYG